MFYDMNYKVERIKVDLSFVFSKKNRIFAACFENTILFCCNYLNVFLWIMLTNRKKSLMSSISRRISIIATGFILPCAPKRIAERLAF